MDCHHYTAGRCRSCSWLLTPYADQVTAKQARCAEALEAYPDLVWEPAWTGTEAGFRNKAKMVVSGTAAEPVLGILGPDGGVDLQDCGLHVPALVGALPVLAAFVTRAALTPYDVAARSGELKYLLVTASPTGGLLVRFVCRSQEPVTRIRKHLPWLAEQLLGLQVASVNVQPEHKAVLEGDLEIVLTATEELAFTVNGIDLALRPQSFFQTNTEVAAGLYRTACTWLQDLRVARAWDLYCGAGGFTFHLEDVAEEVTGIEISAGAVASARATAQRTGSGARFVCGDAPAYALEQGAAPDLVVVNPPRRGIGPELAGWLQDSGVPRVLYSSCNPDSLAADLALMPGLVPVRGQVFDMFPQTAHAEVLVLAERSVVRA